MMDKYDVIHSLEPNIVRIQSQQTALEQTPSEQTPNCSGEECNVLSGSLTGCVVVDWFSVCDVYDWCVGHVVDGLRLGQLKSKHQESVVRN